MKVLTEKNNYKEATGNKQDRKMSMIKVVVGIFVVYFKICLISSSSHATMFAMVMISAQINMSALYGNKNPHRIINKKLFQTS